MAQYGREEYWNERYQVDQECFSWYQKYSGFRHLITSEFLSSGDAGDSSAAAAFPDRKTARVLIFGCGNDDLGESMLSDGWEGGIVNVDYSSVVIQQMREKYDDAFHTSLKKRLNSERQLGAKKGGETEDDVPMIGMRFDCHDVTKALPYADGSFDLIISKGTLDAVLCSAGSKSSVRAMMEESCRVLDKDHGAMITVSYGSKDDRLVYFENPANEWWKGGVTFHSVTKPALHSPGVDERCSPYHYAIISKKHGNNCGPSSKHDGRIDCESPNSVPSNENAIGTNSNSFSKRLLSGISEETSISLSH